MNVSSNQIPMQNLRDTRTTEVIQLRNDLKIVGTPQNLRKVLNRVDTLEQSHAATVTSAYATSCAAFAASTALAPSVVTAAETCNPKSPDNDCISCGVDFP